MKVLFNFIIVIALISVGCTKTEAPKTEGSAHQKETAQGQHKEGSQDEHKEEANVLHMEPSMLRDLKLTTTSVEACACGENSSMLGELRVNENTYAEVGAPVASRIAAVHVTPGQSVSAGQAMATLQSSELGSARAQYLKAQTRVDLAEKTLERKRRLVGERIVAQREVFEAEAELQSARAELRASQAELKALGASIDEAGQANDSPLFMLRSPVRGVVIDRAAVRGQLADPATPLFRVGDLSTLWLTVHAFERDAIQVKPGSIARVTFAALPGQSFNGRVTLVGKLVEAESRTIPIRIEIANRDGVLRPGMSASAFVPVGNAGKGVLAIPAQAAQRIGEKWVVFMPRDEEGEFEIREIGRGRDLGGDVEVVSGVKAGEKVVVNSAFILKAQAEKARGGDDEHAH